MRDLQINTKANMSFEKEVMEKDIEGKKDANHFWGNYLIFDLLSI
jgi:hypothetical protein